jgi:hypothetical protein
MDTLEIIECETFLFGACFSLYIIVLYKTFVTNHVWMLLFHGEIINKRRNWGKVILLSSSQKVMRQKAQINMKAP